VIIPRHLMGRIMGILLFASFGTYPISVALGGVLTNHFGPVILFPFSGLILGLTILFGISQRELREL
ncbi:MAG TPA: MFS transporter, partial [Ktedonobacteraceae bacterium]|nr:MFS transporter [Ktedonobacteraceae bacterium]